jgi:hypothetical protein
MFWCVEPGRLDFPGAVVPGSIGQIAFTATLELR